MRHHYSSRSGKSKGKKIVLLVLLVAIIGSMVFLSREIPAPVQKVEKNIDDARLKQQ